MPSHSIFRKPRNLELLLYIFKHEGVYALDLVRAGFSKPQIYIMLGNLMNAGFIRAEPFEVKTPRGSRLRRIFFTTDSGKAVAKHLLEVEKIALSNLDRRTK